MRRRLARLVLFNSYGVMALLLGLVWLWLLGLDGLNWLDLAAVALYAAAAAAIGWALRAPRAAISQFASVAAFDRALRGARRPTLVEFYSDYSAGCMLARPSIERLQRQADQRLQIVRIDVATATGRALADRYNVLLTPTFLLFDSHGVKEAAFTLVLDRPRVLYWLDQQTVTP